jgi:hypothetical protein
MLGGGWLSRSARETGVAASNPRRLSDEDSSHIFFFLRRTLAIVQAAGVFGHTTLGGSPSYQGMSGYVAKRN